MYIAIPNVSCMCCCVWQVDLHKAENRWVRQTQVAPTEDGEMEELFRKFQAILNKLTPQKFKNLAEQALNLKIDSEQRLKGCIDKIFTKVCVCVG